VPDTAEFSTVHYPEGVGFGLSCLFQKYKKQKLYGFIKTTKEKAAEVLTNYFNKPFKKQSSSKQQLVTGYLYQRKRTAPPL
jgi:hypothetical protein